MIMTTIVINDVDTNNKFTDDYGDYDDGDDDIHNDYTYTHNDYCDYYILIVCLRGGPAN